jgi:hypothetical protein
MVATQDSLTVRYLPPSDFPDSPTSNRIAIRIGCIPDVHLGHDFLQDGTASLPGLDLRISGNVVENSKRTISFSLKQKLHGAFYYEIVYTFPPSLRDSDVPTLVISVKKTDPPASRYLM